MGKIFLNMETKKPMIHSSFRLKKNSEKCVALQNLSIYYTWKNITQLYKNNDLKIIASIWNVSLADDSYSVSDSQYYIYYIIKNMKH